MYRVKAINNFDSLVTVLRRKGDDLLITVLYLSLLMKGGFPNNIRGNKIKTKLVSINIKMRSFNKHKIVYEESLVVKSIHNSKDPLTKV